MTAALEGDEWSAARPGRTLPPGKEPIPIVQEAFSADLDRRKMSPPGFDSGPSSPQSVTIPTELPGPHIIWYLIYYTLYPIFRPFLAIIRLSNH